jgi:hypothetical protein
MFAASQRREVSAMPANRHQRSTGRGTVPREAVPLVREAGEGQ